MSSSTLASHHPAPAPAPVPVPAIPPFSSYGSAPADGTDAPDTPAALASITTPALRALLEPITVPSSSPRASFTNWGRAYTCTPRAVFEPRTERECALVLELARRDRARVRPAGVGHSPSDVACTREYMLRSTKLDRVLEVDSEKLHVTAQGGITLHGLHTALAAHGLAMSNLGSISEQTLAGVVTTATHGTGLAYPVISAHVLALYLLLADGSAVWCSRTEHPDLFSASLCGLGATGVILRVRLQVERRFRLRETCETLPFDAVVHNLESIADSAEHVRMWWFPQAGVVRVSRAWRTTEPSTPEPPYAPMLAILWHHFLQSLLLLAIFITPLNALAARLVAWTQRKPSVRVDDGWRVFNVDCLFPQQTIEYALPYVPSLSSPPSHPSVKEDASVQTTRAFLLSLRELLASPSLLSTQHFPVEIRFSAADDIWMSPSYGRRTCWVGVVVYKPYGLPTPHTALFAAFSALAARSGGRPHWAKPHALRPRAPLSLSDPGSASVGVPEDQKAQEGTKGQTLEDLYPMFPHFVQVLRTYDPTGLWHNEYIARHIFGRALRSGKPLLAASEREGEAEAERAYLIRGEDI